jgi:Lon protease-like protein
MHGDFMMDLPLFPLNSVLFPGMPLRLHIFEDRYKEMINECVEQQSPFGVVLIAEGQEAQSSLAKPHLIGTTAYISQVQRLALGRMNILAIGKERFKINQLDAKSRSFLMGEVEMMPFEDKSSLGLARGAAKLRGLVERYLIALSEAGQLQVDTSQIPRDTLSLAYLAAMLLQDDIGSKQHLLEASNTKDFVRLLLRHYQREVAFIDVMLKPPADEEDDSPFSIN